MTDDTVTDVLVNGPSEVWVERAGVLQRESIAFETDEDLYRLIERLVAEAGARVDSAHPVADARLSDGSRLHVALPPVAPHGPLLSIRRWPRRAWTIERLVGGGMLSPEQASLLVACVIDRKTVVIGGGTGTGKTTLLNALLGRVPSHERVVVIEETPELSPSCEHHVSLVARPPNEAGVGGVDLAALLRSSLRMRPDRIVVGEVRGSEASVALAAMSTGHPGSLLTVHASSVAGAVRRLIDLSSRDGSSSENAVAATLEAAVDVWVHLERVGPRRKVVEIVER
jgi:pilus assembly protein CpaF